VENKGRVKNQDENSNTPKNHKNEEKRKTACTDEGMSRKQK